MQGRDRSEGGILGHHLNGMGHQRLQKPNSAIVVRYMVKAVPVRLLFQCAIGIATEEGRHVTGLSQCFRQSMQLFTVGCLTVPGVGR